MCFTSGPRVNLSGGDQSMERSLTTRRVSTVRRVGWLGVASLLALALLAPSAGVVSALSGAVYTSNIDGSIINANIYDSKSAVYLTGGPCNGGSHLAAGDYYFEVSSPSGDLLSSDAISERKFTVGANGFITSTAGGHATNPVNCSPPVTGITVQLFPYDDTPNNGGEYKLTIATASSVEACAGFSASSDTFEICTGADQKSDNFKARFGNPAIDIEKVANPAEVPAAGGIVTYTYTVLNAGDVPLSTVTVSDDKCSPVVFVGGDTHNAGLLDLDETWTYTCTTTITVTTLNTATALGHDGQTEVSDTDTATVTVLPPTAPPPTATPTAPPPTATPTAPPATATPTVAPTPTFVQSVAAETDTPTVTLPPTDSFGGGSAPADGTWRLALIAMAALLASVLVMTPARATRRR
ncbi:MAG: hypothetical protein EPO36_03540 [Chloroflexota bacterium]|nr:MAG: hypothetical protein EPO36_03540 [Chloroflexota bacterium]